jgi:translocation and assembly module TamB
MDETTPAKKRSRWRWPLRLLLLLLALPVVLVLLMQTPPAKRLIAEQASSLGSQFAPWPVLVRDIQGTLPFDVRIGQVALGPPGAPWFETENLGVQVRLAPLLGGYVHVNYAGAERVALHALPPAPETPPDPAPVSYAMPAIPGLPDWIIVDRLAMERLDLGAPVLGSAAAFAIQGTVQPEDSQRMHLTITGLDQTDVTVQLEGGWFTDDVALALSMHDASLAPALLGLEGPLDLHLALSGPWQQVHTQLQATLALAPLAELDLMVGLQSPLQWEGTGRITPPAALLPEAARPHLGEAMAFALKGALAEDGMLSLDTATLAAGKVNVAATGRIALADLMLDLGVDLSHDDLGIAVPASQSGGPLPAHVRLELRGTPAALEVGAQGTLRGEEWIDGTAQVAQGVPLTAQGAFTMRPAGGLLPPELDALLRDGAALDFDVRYAGTALTIRDTRLRAAGTLLELAGDMELTASQLDMKAGLQVDDLAAFQGLAGVPLGGALGVQITAQGDAGQTGLEVGLQLSDLVVPQVHAPEGTLSAQVVAGGFPDALAEQWAVKLQGAFPALQLADSPGRDLKVDADFAVAGLERITINTLGVGDGNLALTAQGNLDWATRAGALEAAVEIADLKPYATLAGAPYGGKVALRATAGSTDTPGHLLASLDGTLRELSGLPDTLADLAGPEVALRAEGGFDGATAALNTLKLNLALGEVTGSGTYALASQEVDARIKAALPELKRLTPVTAQPMSGDLIAEAHATGTLEGLAVKGTLVSTALTAGPWRSEATRVVFDATGIPAQMKGSASLTAAQGDEVLALETRAAYSGTLLAIDDLQLTAGGNRVVARGQFNSATLRGGGEVEAALPALAALNAWVDLPLAGGLSVNAQLTEATGGLAGALSAQALEVPGLTIGDAEATFDLTGLFDQPGGRLALQAHTLAAQDLAVAHLTLTAEGPYDQLQTTLDTAGVYGTVTPFALQANATLGTAPLQMQLNTLAGKVDALELHLAEPAQVQYSAAALHLTPLRIAVAGGSLHAAGDMEAERVALQAGWEDIPLSLAALAGGPELEGSTRGTIDVSGTRAAPEMRAAIRVDGVRFSDPESTAPPLNVGIDATLNPAGMEARLSAEAGPEVQVELAASSPFTVQLEPFALDYSDATPVQGKLDATVELATLPQILLIEDQAMAGTLHADFDLAGTVGVPGVTGALTLAAGYYENAVSGTILDQLNVRLEAAEDAIRLAEFSANDTVGGSLAATGTVQLDADAGFPFAMDVTLRDPRLVHRDEISAKAGGTLRITGNASGAQVAGNLRAGPAYITMPERLPAQSVTTVEFTVAEEGEAEPSMPEDPVPPYRIALDIACAIPGQIFVRAPTLDSEWEGDLKIGGYADDPLIKGVLNIRKGYLDFLGSTFQLDESTIAFDGTSPPSPYLNVLAKSEKADLTALLRLEGDPSSLALVLDSDPPVPRDEILSQILFGQSVSEISAVQAIQLARYAPLFSNKMSAASVLSSGSAKPLMLDRLNLRSGSGAGDASVSAGKYIGNDFYVEFQQGLGSQKSEASIEWRFAPNWALKGKTGSNAEGGAGLFWKKNY